MAADRVDMREEIPALITQARREAIAAELARRPFLSTQEIVALFGCSPATARRDLHALAAAGRIRRSRGGAAALEAPMPGAHPDQRVGSPPASVPFLAEKRRIARAAVA